MARSTAEGPRVGIIGTGFMGHVHARAVQSAGGHVVAVVGSTPERAEIAVKELRADRAVASVEELISTDDIDVVHVCVPNHLHAEYSLAALSAGKHVVCEKPLAVTAEDAAQLVDAAEAADRVAAVPFVYRFYTTVRDARARVARGDAGALKLIHGSYLQDWLATPSDRNWRVNTRYGGASRAFADIGVHWCDLAEFTTGHRITRLSGRLLTAYPSRHGGDDPRGNTATVDTEDAATVIFETDHGALGVMAVSQISHGRKNSLQLSLDGTESSITFDQENPDALWIGRQDENTILPRGGPLETPAASPYGFLPPGHPQGYQDAFNAFVGDVFQAIEGGNPDGLPTFADGLRAARLTSAVLESAKDGSWVEVGE